MIGAQGASTLAAVLKETKISNLEYAAAPKVLAFVSAPADTFANTFTSPGTHSQQRQKASTFLPLSLPEHFLPCTSPPTSKSEHVPSLVPSRAFPSLVLPDPSPARKHTSTHPHPPSPHTRAHQRFP